MNGTTQRSIEHQPPTMRPPTFCSAIAAALRAASRHLLTEFTFVSDREPLFSECAAQRPQCVKIPAEVGTWMKWI